MFIMGCVTVCFAILLPRPLRHDPRLIQCIYRYSHASKRLVEVYNQTRLCVYMVYVTSASRYQKLKVEVWFHGIDRVSSDLKRLTTSYCRPVNRTDDDYMSAKIRCFATREAQQERILLLGGVFNLPDIKWKDAIIVDHR